MCRKPPDRACSTLGETVSTGGGASRVVWLSHRVLWEPPPRGRIPPAARSGRKARSRRGRRSYRGWGQPGSLATAQNTVGAPAPGANPAGRSEWPEGSIAPRATLLQGVGSAGWFGHRSEYCRSPRPGGEYRRPLGVAGRLNRAEGDAPTGGGASRVVWLSHRVLWEPPPRGRILPAARSSRKVQSRRGRRSYRGWGQPGSLATAQNTVGAPAPGANSAGRSEWPEGSIAPRATLLQGVGAAG